jgi:hypothetical protein
LHYGSAVVVHSPTLQSGQLTEEQASAPAEQPAAAGIVAPLMAGVADVMEMVSVNVKRPFVLPSSEALWLVGW